MTNQAFWGLAKEVQERYIKTATIRPLIPQFLRFVSNLVDEGVQCSRCKQTFFFDGCPHCGNTFLKRSVLRQTS